jgi:hypothetical protein
MSCAAGTTVLRPGMHARERAFTITSDTRSVFSAQRLVVRTMVSRAKEGISVKDGHRKNSEEDDSLGSHSVLLDLSVNASEFYDWRSHKKIPCAADLDRIVPSGPNHVQPIVGSLAR